MELLYVMKCVNSWWFIHYYRFTSIIIGVYIGKSNHFLDLYMHITIFPHNTCIQNVMYACLYTRINIVPLQLNCYFCKFLQSKYDQHAAEVAS